MRWRCPSLARCPGEHTSNPVPPDRKPGAPGRRLLDGDLVRQGHGSDRVVLHDVDLGLSPARLVTLEGANGSGKSTPLRLIAGVVRPTSGSVRGVPGRVGYLPERFEPPRLVVLDEPGTGLEASAWPVLDQLVADHVGRGALMVRTEHDPAVLAAANDRLSVRDGAVERLAAPSAASGPGHQRVRAHRLADPALDPAEPVRAVPTTRLGRDDTCTLSERVPAQDKDECCCGC